MKKPKCSVCPDDVKSIPKNLKKYQTGGKSKDVLYNIDRAIELGYEPDETGHMPSVDNTNGMWLKSKKHPTANKELMAYTLNLELQRQLKHPIVNQEGYFGDDQLQYQEKALPKDLKKYQVGTNFLKESASTPKIPKELQRFDVKPKSTSGVIKKDVGPEATYHKVVDGIKARFNDKTPDSLSENLLEFVDPSGISSYDDAGKAYSKWGKENSFLPTGEEALDMFGAVPMLGKFSKLKYLVEGKGLMKSAYKYFPWQKAVNTTDGSQDVYSDNLKVEGTESSAKRRKTIEKNTSKFKTPLSKYQLGTVFVNSAQDPRNLAYLDSTEVGRKSMQYLQQKIKEGSLPNVTDSGRPVRRIEDLLDIDSSKIRSQGVTNFGVVGVKSFPKGDPAAKNESMPRTGLPNKPTIVIEGPYSIREDLHQMPKQEVVVRPRPTYTSVPIINPNISANFAENDALPTTTKIPNSISFAKSQGSYDARGQKRFNVETRQWEEIPKGWFNKGKGKGIEDLPKFELGGAPPEKKPRVITNLKDFKVAEEAYKDSSDLYNFYMLQKKLDLSTDRNNPGVLASLFNPPPKFTEAGQRRQTELYNKAQELLKNNPSLKTGLHSHPFATKEHYKNLGSYDIHQPGIEPKGIWTGSARNSDYSNVKPVQPVIYKPIVDTPPKPPKPPKPPTKESAVVQKKVEQAPVIVPPSIAAPTPIVKKDIERLMMPSGSYMQKDDFIKKYGESAWRKASGQK